MSVVCIGPFPPPVHGMAKNLLAVSEEIAKSTKVYNISTSPGTIVKGFSYHIVKFYRVVFAIFLLLKRVLFDKVTTLYLPPDAGLGVYYSLVFVALSRVFKLRIFLHHRSFAYINEYRGGMKWLTWIAGKNATHIFLCQEMSSKFNAIYPFGYKSRVVSNAYHVKPIDEENIKLSTDVLIMGHLSNISIEKGLLEVISTFEKLRQKKKVKLIIAGPTENEESKLHLDEALEKFKDEIEYWGYADIKMKEKFYSSIDIFLFPTKYKNEAQPNVIFEANAFAVPVIALERGCICSDVLSDNGCVVSLNKNFSDAAVEQIMDWHITESKFLTLRKSTLVYIKQAKFKAVEDFRYMINEISGVYKS